MKIKHTCPFGSECEVAKDGYIERCAWYVHLKGTDKLGDDHDESACAIAWMPILQIEVAGVARGQTVATEQLRNIVAGVPYREQERINHEPS